MLKRALVVLAFLLMPMVANAGAPVPFDANEFTAAQTAGRTILVQVHADWCPACAAQRPIIVGLASTDQFSNMVIFNIDYDTQKDLVFAVRGAGAEHSDCLQGRNRNRPRPRPDIPGRHSGVADHRPVGAVIPWDRVVFPSARLQGF